MSNANDNTNGPGEEAILSTLLAEAPQLWSVVDAFVRTLPDQVTAMREALHHQSFDRLEILAKQLHQAGIENGYRAIADRAAGIEQAANDQVIDALTERIDEFTQLINKIQENLRQPDEPTP